MRSLSPMASYLAWSKFGSGGAPSAVDSPGLETGEVRRARSRQNRRRSRVVGRRGPQEGRGEAAAAPHTGRHGSPDGRCSARGLPAWQRPNKRPDGLASGPHPRARPRLVCTDSALRWAAWPGGCRAPHRVQYRGESLGGGHFTIWAGPDSVMKPSARRRSPGRRPIAGPHHQTIPVVFDTVQQRPQLGTVSAPLHQLLGSARHSDRLIFASSLLRRYHGAHRPFIPRSRQPSAAVRLFRRCKCLLALRNSLLFPALSPSAQGAAAPNARGGRRRPTASF